MESSESQISVPENHPDSPQPPKVKRNRQWWWLLLALLLLGGGIGIWRLLAAGNESPATTATQPEATKVKLSEVETATVNESSEYIANLESRRSVNLQPRIEGRITKILVRAGDEVAAGTPLIQIEPDEQQAAVSSSSAATAGARAELENARATLSSLEAQRLSNLSDVQYNQKEFRRYSSLADQGAVARSLADQYTNRIQTAKAGLAAINQQIQAQKANVAQAQKAVLQAEANTREQEVQLQYYKISAPFAGTVGDIPVKVGDFVDNSTQLTNVTQNQPLEVNTSVPIERGAQLRQGMPVELLDGQGRSLGISRVFFIAPNTTNDSQSVLIKSLFDNSKNQLRADQYVRAKVIWNRRSGVLIPTTAVTRLGGENFVYVAQPQQPSQQEQSQSAQEQPKLVAQQRRVKLGNIQGNNYQVLEGLKPGERIVVSGILNLKDGAGIMPE